MGNFASLSAAILALTAVTYGQAAVPQLPPPQQQPEPKVFRSTASMVALNVTVTEGDKLVTGLHAADFEVYEDGVQQQVRFFESTATPMDVILLLDTSSSMRDRMPVVHDAAKGFMKILRLGDRGAVVAFADNVRVVQDLTSDTAAIKSAINSTTAKGATALYNAIYVSLKQFGRKAQSNSDVRRQAIAVLSDGEDTSSLIALDDVLALARKTGVNIYTIGLRSEYRRSQPSADSLKFRDSTFALKALAKETGAQAFFPANVHELKNVYDSIARELEAQYSLAYSPTNTRNDGQFRRIRVRVPSNPSLRPRTRPGYTADASSANVGIPPAVLRYP